MQADAGARALRIFCSFSHADEPFRQRLEVHLAPLVRARLIDFWHDRRISPGVDWQAEIDHHLAQADIILLLVSPDFLASAYVDSFELKPALERHERAEARVVPIITRPSLWSLAPFAKLQVLPSNATPVSRWPDADEAWENIARGILQVASELRALVGSRSQDVEAPPAADVEAPPHEVAPQQRAASAPSPKTRQRTARKKTPPPPTTPTAPSARATASFPDALMQALRALLPQNDLFVGADIPPQKLANARHACGVPAGEQIIALIDATVLGSAKNALLIGSRAIYYHNDWSGKHSGAGRIDYADFASRTFAPEGLELCLGPGQYFDVSGSSVKQAKLIEILQAVQRVSASFPQITETDAANVATSSSRVFDALAKALLPLTPHGDLYVGSPLPPHKLANARDACQVPAEEQIVALVDATVFGSAKNALLVGTEAIYYHNDWSSKQPGPARLPYADIASRTFAAEGPHEISLGPGAYFNVSGSAVKEATLIAILRTVQQVIASLSPEPL